LNEQKILFYNSGSKQLIKLFLRQEWVLFKINITLLKGFDPLQMLTKSLFLSTLSLHCKKNIFMICNHKFFSFVKSTF